MACQFTFEAIGTGWVIDINEEIHEEARTSLLSDIRERINQFDKDYSRFRADSLITEMSKKSGTYRMPSDADILISTYKKFYDLTQGLFTPLIGDVIVDAGYDAHYSLKQKQELSAPPSWNEVIEYSFPELTVKKPVVLDFGAAGKGYLIDIVAEFIETKGIKSYCVDAGGDIRQRSEHGNLLRVGLEDPEDFSKAIGVALLSNKSLCASAGSRRKWDSFHHIINPETLTSPTEIIACWTITETTILADALSTSLFFVEPSLLSTHFSFEYLIMRSNRSVETSASFPAELFIN